MNDSEYSPDSTPKIAMTTIVKRAKADVCKSKPIEMLDVNCNQWTETDKSGCEKRKVDSTTDAKVVSNVSTSLRILVCLLVTKQISPARMGTKIG